MPTALYAPQRPAPTLPDVSHLPEWARLTFDDVVSSSRMVGAEDLVDELLVSYLTLSGPEERCWPARAYWREMVPFMGEARRTRLALARLWPEFLRFRQGRRSPGCGDIRKLLLAGGYPRGLDCLHAARCEHCRMFSLYLRA